ncbi:hypothetical protein Tco_1358157, partial [Tanacetum coccineum]
VGGVTLASVRVPPWRDRVRDVAAMTDIWR